MPPPAIPPTKPARRAAVAACAGFSLVELLTAAALSLVVMLAVTGLFSSFSRGVSDSRAIGDLSAQMRTAAWRLRQDLDGLTCRPAPLVRVEANAGYFQVVEGSRTTKDDPYGYNPASDSIATVTAFSDVYVGDIDDLLALTTSSPGAPFVGSLAGAGGFESPTAEVVWFCEPSGQFVGSQELYNLHRRQLLVSAAPDAGAFANNVFAAPGGSDLACRTHALSLGDLSKPANRFLSYTAAASRRLTGAREGEDVILRHVLWFDVRIVETAQPVDKAFSTSDVGDPGSGPLRGVEIRIRCIEPGSQSVRDFKVVHSFGAG